MAKFELLKSIEAKKLNRRTLRAIGTESFTIPYGAIVENITEDRDRRKFFYLGDPYECFEFEMREALRELK
jgi:hypothetical protein